MQTFLPYSDFYESARVLDRQRLGKQRIEVLQILNALITGPYTDCPLCGGKDQDHLLLRCERCHGKGEYKTPWYNHPAVKMWRGCEYALCVYGVTVCNEWIRRGFQDTIRPKLQDIGLDITTRGDSYILPLWLGDAAFHAAHRAALLAKDPEWYGQFGWTETPGINYLYTRER